ncbi:hypothetical protein [Fodinibius salsisoli]|uniref:Uncharacterized protein n=1 Tax=Fodinibius salsisoli TaxID=2820877 RepID=A0ABT3PH31_9BACT|nr:hypothetical protein [Fodinibius salsisoli]MCW9705222.1 hypothetical protein [Fodinibius salsisoli]
MSNPEDEDTSMAQNMKQRLRDQKKQDHEEFRQQMVQDVMEQLTEWREATNCIMAKNHRVIKDAVNQMKIYERRVNEVGKNLSSIEYKTLTEIKRFKRGRSWKFFAACLLSAIIGGFTTVVIWAKYWGTLRYLLE